MPSPSPARMTVDDVLDHIDDGVFVLDEEGRFVFVNRAAERMLGFPQEALLGARIFERFPAAIGSLTYQVYQRAQVDRTATEYEDFFPTLGRWLEVRVIPAGKRLLLSMRDVTERRAMNERLQRSEARFHSLMKATRQAVWVTQASGAVVEDIPHWREFTGLTYEEAVGFGWASAIHPDDRAGTLSAWAAAVAGAFIFEVRHRLRRADGVYRHMTSRAVPLRDAEGKVIEWVGASIDETEQVLAEQERGERAWLLAETQRLAHVGSASWDATRRLVTWSDEQRRICGIAPGEEPRTLEEMLACVHRDDRARVAAAVAAAIGERRAPLAETLRFLRPNGEIRHLELSAEIRFSEDGEPLHVVAAVQDVTDRERAAVAESELAQNLVKAQKLQSLGVLAGGIAHDVNNLLVGILGNASLALAEAGPMSPLVEPLTDIVTTAQRAAELAHQLLAYSGKGRFATAPLDLSAFLADQERLLATMIAPGAELHIDAPPNLPAFEADSGQIRQVIVNLVTNASDALGAGTGTLTMRSGVVRATTALLRSSFVDDQLPEGDYVFIEVADTGKGMTPATTARMFDPFFTTKNSGHGLGLAATLGIVRGHRGAIKVETEPGRGSKITALFPAAKLPEQALPPRAERSSQAGGTILVVDDDELVRRVAKRMLVRAGYQVLEAENGKVALAMYEAHKDALALVLLDLSMPVMGGEETFGALRALAPGLPIVLSSGYNEDDATSRFVGRGLAAFVQKPFAMAEFLGIIRQTLQA